MPIHGNWLGSGHPSPTQYASAVLKGAASYDEVPSAIQSLLRKPIYDHALRIMKINDKQGRISALQSLPESIRLVTQQEVMRLWQSRAQLLK